MLTATRRQQQHKSVFGSLRAREEHPQPPASTQLAHYLCGQPCPKALTLSWASEKPQGPIAGMETQL